MKMTFPNVPFQSCVLINFSVSRDLEIQNLMFLVKGLPDGKTGNIILESSHPCDDCTQDRTTTPKCFEQDRMHSKKYDSNMNLQGSKKVCPISAHSQKNLSGFFQKMCLDY